MNYRTVEQFVSEHREFKPASLYAALREAITRGSLRGTAIPLNRNDRNGGKFTIEKATAREGKETTREVTNFVLLEPDKVEAWLEENAKGIRKQISTSKQMVMPRLEDIEAGHYSEEQLREIAAHVSTKRYGEHRSNKRTGKVENLEGTAKPVRKPGRPRKNAEATA